MDRRQSEFEWWHKQVFEEHPPTRNAIPHHVTRNYLDLQWELQRARAGVDTTILRRSIAEIKATGRAYYDAEKGHTEATRPQVGKGNPNQMPTTQTHQLRVE